MNAVPGCGHASRRCRAGCAGPYEGRRRPDHDGDSRHGNPVVDRAGAGPAFVSFGHRVDAGRTNGRNRRGRRRRPDHDGDSRHADPIVDRAGHRADADSAAPASRRRLPVVVMHRAGAGPAAPARAKAAGGPIMTATRGTGIRSWIAPGIAPMPIRLHRLRDGGSRLWSCIASVPGRLRRPVRRPQAARSRLRFEARERAGHRADADSAAPASGRRFPVVVMHRVGAGLAAPARTKAAGGTITTATRGTRIRSILAPVPGRRAGAYQRRRM